MGLGIKEVRVGARGSPTCPVGLALHLYSHGHWPGGAACAEWQAERPASLPKFESHARARAPALRTDGSVSIVWSGGARRVKA